MSEQIEKVETIETENVEETKKEEIVQAETKPGRIKTAWSKVVAWGKPKLEAAKPKLKSAAKYAAVVGATAVGTVLVLGAVSNGATEVIPEDPEVFDDDEDEEEASYETDDFDDETDEDDDEEEETDETDE